MVERRKKNAPATFDVHRTLPVNSRRSPLDGGPSRHSRSRQLPVDGGEPKKDTPLKVPKEKKPLWRRILRWFFRIFLVALIILIVFSVYFSVWDYHNITSATQKMFGSSNILALARGGPLKTDANGRVNVLIAGYSVDDPGHQGADLTDSILLLSMNPAKHTGYMLSIPRDLWVNIPGFGYSKINAAYEDGGMSLLEQVVNTDFGVQSQYYAIVDYTAVKDIVDALGGITVDIQSPDPRGLYDPNINKQDGGPLLLKNGVQTLDGQQALNLTRARGDSPNSYGFPQSDFDRTQHQRQVFQAIKAKLSWKLVLDPEKNSQILNAMAANVKTNLQITEVRPLFGLFNKIPNSKLQSVSLNSVNGQDLLQSFYTYDGEDALVPTAGPTDFSQIQAAVAQLDQT